MKKIRKNKGASRNIRIMGTKVRFGFFERKVSEPNEGPARLE